MPRDIAFPSFAAIICLSGKELSVMKAQISFSKESGTPAKKSTSESLSEEKK
jgi:hypothetical protein